MITPFKTTNNLTVTGNVTASNLFYDISGNSSQWNTAYRTVSGGVGPYTLVNATSSIQPLIGNNIASGCYSSVLGGSNNNVSSCYNSIVNGLSNTIIGNVPYATISNGCSNSIYVDSNSNGCNFSIYNSLNSSISSTSSNYGGYCGNVCSANNFVVGGIKNKITTTASGYYNSATSTYYPGSAVGTNSFIVGGSANAICLLNGGNGSYGPRISLACFNSDLSLIHI